MVIIMHYSVVLDFFSSLDNVVALKRAVGLLACRFVKAEELGRLLFRLLGEKDGLDVGKNTSLGNGDPGEQLVQFLVVSDGELEMTGDDPGLFVVSGSVSGQLEDLSGQVLHDGSQVDGGTRTHSLGVVALPQKPMDTTHWELESCTAGSRLCLSLHLSSLATARHDDEVSWVETWREVLWVRCEQLVMDFFGSELEFIPTG